MIKITMEFASLAEASSAIQMLMNPTGAVETQHDKNVRMTADVKAMSVAVDNQASRVSTKEALAAYVGQSNQEAAELAKLSAVKAEAPKEAEAVSTPTPSESAAPGVTYDELKSSIMKLVAINPNHMRAVCEQFGVKTFQGTDAATWAKAKDVIDAKVAELKAA